MDSPLDEAVADYQAGMSRFLGLNATQSKVLAQRYKRGLEAFKQSLSTIAREEGLVAIKGGRGR